MNDCRDRIRAKKWPTQRERYILSKTVDKALRLLMAFDGSAPEYSLTELADRFAYDNSTVARLLKSLAAVELVSYHPKTRKYRLGPRVLELANQIHVHHDIREAAMPEMVRLRDQTGESVGLCVPVGDRRVYTDRVQSQQELCWVMPLGLLLSCNIGSTGKVMLAYKSPEAVKRILAQPLENVTPNTIVDPEQFWREVMQAKQQGYALSNGERTMGLASVSAPILANNGYLLGALTLAGPVGRVTTEKLIEYAALLKAATRRIGDV